MKETDLIWTCAKCGKEFRVFADDGGGDFTVCWNWCPHCGAKNNIWIRFVNPNNRADSEIPLGVSSAEGMEIQKLKQKSEVRNIYPCGER